jgi:hypothetical protein
MVTTDAGVLISHRQIREWEAEIARLQRNVALARELLGGVAAAAGTAKGETHATGTGADASFMGSIVKIANGENPVSRQDIRAKLAEMGFSQDKITKQFNTVLYKTMKAKRVSFLPNGKIWKGAK